MSCVAGYDSAIVYGNCTLPSMTRNVNRNHNTNVSDVKKEQILKTKAKITRPRPPESKQRHLTNLTFK